MNSFDHSEDRKYLISPLGSQVVVPNMIISCNGTIIGLTVNLTEIEDNEINNDGDRPDQYDDNDDNDIDDGDEESDVDRRDQNDKKRETSGIQICPSIQVWHSKPVYTKAGQYNLCDSDIKTDGKLATANVALTVNKGIRIQSGDIIGYYVPANSNYSILNIQAMENASYSINASTALDEFVINDSVTGFSMLPMIQVMFGKKTSYNNS